MKIKPLKFDQFAIYVFTYDKGETRKYKADEINRGLKNFGDKTLYTISVYTKGKFVVHRPGEEDYVCMPGMGGFRFAIADNMDNLVLESLEDGSEYHCITPRGKEAVFWNRSVKVIEPGLGLIDGAPNKYLYIASGEMENNGTIYKDCSLIKLESDAAFDVKKQSIVVTLWI